MIYDNRLKRKKRPPAGSGDIEFDGASVEEVPDITDDLSAIDMALKMKPRKSTNSCGCSKCGPRRNCPEHPGCDGGG